jgi:hypothetical protein
MLQARFCSIVEIASALEMADAKAVMILDILENDEDGPDDIRVLLPEKGALAMQAFFIDSDTADGFNSG